MEIVLSLRSKENAQVAMLIIFIVLLENCNALIVEIALILFIVWQIVKLCVENVVLKVINIVQNVNGIIIMSRTNKGGYMTKEEFADEDFVKKLQKGRK